MDNISETKTPTPGEWWLRNRDGRIFYICGFDPEGWVVHYNENVGLYTSKMRFFCREFRHEPRCTGFGWLEPLKVTEAEARVTSKHCVDCGVSLPRDGGVACSVCRECPNDMPLNPVPGKVVARGTVTFTPVKSPDHMAAIIAEHTQQVRELTQRIGELAQQVNERDAMIEKIRTALRQDYSV